MAAANAAFDLNINTPITLKCGLTLPNRLVKAAMAAHLADKDHLPGNAGCLAVYGEWAKGGWGMVLTGLVSCFNEDLKAFD